MLKLNNKNKLLYSIMCLLLLGLAASTFVAYSEVRNNLISSVHNNQLTKADAASAKLTQWLNSNLSIIKEFANTLSRSEADLRDNTHYQFYLRQTLKTQDFFYLYYALEEDGYSWFADWETPEGYEPRLRPWYLASKRAQKPLITDPYRGLDETLSLYVAVTAPIIKNDRFIGVASGDLKLDFVKQTILNIKLDMGGFAFLVKSNGDILVHPDESLMSKSVNNLHELGVEPLGNIIDHTFETQDYFYYAYPIDHSDWYLYFTFPKREINSIIISKTVRLLIEFSAIFIVFLILFYALNRHLLTPVIDFLERDSATGLPNKKHFKQLVSDQYFTHGQDGMLLIISTDDFNQLTATYPTTVINELQKQICHRVESSLNGKSVLGLFSESRFIAYLPNNTGQLQEQDRTLQLQALNDNLNQVYLIAQHKLNCSIRVGASVFPQHGDDIEVLIDKAFSVMALGKKLGKTNISIYSSDIDQQLSNDLLIASAMRNALDNAEFFMVYQPQYNLNNMRFSSVEALIRWNSSELGRTISPYEFIPVAEASNLIIELGNYVIETVVRQISQWHAKGVSFDQVSINISPKQLQQPNFQQNLICCLKRYSVPPQAVELEITETTLLEDPELIIEQLNHLRHAGFSIAIDDFGTGYSSMQYLTKLPFDKLKIDRAFISDLHNNEKNQVIVTLLTKMAHSLKFNILAEGAETEAEVRFLDQIGCHMIQGYYFAKPMPVEQLEKLIGEPEKSISADKGLSC